MRIGESTDATTEELTKKGESELQKRTERRSARAEARDSENCSDEGLPLLTNFSLRELERGRIDS